MSDKELLIRLRRGEEAAVEEAIGRYGAYVAAVVHRTLGSLSRAEDVEELSSDVFFTLWQKRSGLRSENLAPWLAAVARNRARSHLRSLGVPDSELTEELHAPSAESLAAERETRRELASALEELGERDSDIFLRRYYREQSVPEIASATQLHPENVKSRLRRGREKLKKLLDKGGSDR